MHFRKYKFSKAAFLENTSQISSLYIIWLRILSKRKYYFMSEAYLKPSQTSNLKLLANVLNASIFRMSRMVFYKNSERLKAVNFFRKNLHHNIWVLKMPLDSVFNYFHQKLHLWSLRGQICLCMYLVPQIWRLINEITISKVGYEETQKNV